MGLTIEPMVLPADGPLIIGFARDLFAISFGSALRFAEEFGADGSAYVAWISDKQAGAPAHAAIAALCGEPVGMVVIGAWPQNQATGYVFHYYLEPRARGLGLASRLDDYAVSALRRAGYGTARLSVAEANERALRFYRKQGWIDAGPRADQPGILYMERRLAG